MAQSFFGLPGKEYIYEEIFVLHEECGIPYDTCWDMPVAVRKWWFARKMKHERDRQKKPSDASTGSVLAALKKGSQKDGS